MRNRILIFVTMLLLAMPMSALAAPKTMGDGGRFDAQFYAATYPDVVALVGSDASALYNHYLVSGKIEGKYPFNPIEAVGVANSVEAKKVVKPSEEAVIIALSKTPGVTGIEAATEEHDPNHKLHKQGGYLSQVYFETATYLDQNKYIQRDGMSIVDRGTDCGGSIEVYSTVDQAKKRDTYLAGFDGTMFYSGSHIVVGTCVIRTSEDLTAATQMNLTNQIIASLVID